MSDIAYGPDFIKDCRTRLDEINATCSGMYQFFGKKRPKIPYADWSQEAYDMVEKLCKAIDIGLKAIELYNGQHTPETVALLSDHLANYKLLNEEVECDAARINEAIASYGSPAAGGVLTLKGKKSGDCLVWGQQAGIMNQFAVSIVLSMRPAIEKIEADLAQQAPRKPAKASKGKTPDVYVNINKDDLSDPQELKARARDMRRMLQERAGNIGTKCITRVLDMVDQQLIVVGALNLLHKHNADGADRIPDGLYPEAGREPDRLRADIERAREEIEAIRVDLENMTNRSGLGPFGRTLGRELCETLYDALDISGQASLLAAYLEHQCPSDEVLPATDIVVPPSCGVALPDGVEARIKFISSAKVKIQALEEGAEALSANLAKAPRTKGNEWLILACKALREGTIAATHRLSIMRLFVGEIPATPESMSEAQRKVTVAIDSRDQYWRQKKQMETSAGIVFVANETCSLPVEQGQAFLKNEATFRRLWDSYQALDPQINAETMQLVRDLGLS